MTSADRDVSTGTSFTSSAANGKWVDNSALGYEGSDVDYGALDLILDEVAAGKMVGAISAWCGKVNVHLGREGWLTDPDGTSGCDKMDTYAGRLGYCKSIYGDHVSDVQAKGVAGDFLERPPCDMPAIIDARLADFADELQQRWDDWKEQPVYWADMAYQIRTGEDRIRSQDDYDRVMASKYPEEEYQRIKLSIPCDAEWALPEGAGFRDRGNKNCVPGLNKPAYACIARVATTRRRRRQPHPSGALQLPGDGHVPPQRPRLQGRLLRQLRGRVRELRAARRRLRRLRLPRLQHQPAGA